MAKLEVEIPEEMKRELEGLSKIDVSLAATRLIKTELERLARLKDIVSRSRLTEKGVEQLSRKVDRSLSKRFRSTKR